MTCQSSDACTTTIGKGNVAQVKRGHEKHTLEHRRDEVAQAPGKARVPEKRVIM